MPPTSSKIKLQFFEHEGIYGHHSSIIQSAGNLAILMISIFWCKITITNQSKVFITKCLRMTDFNKFCSFQYSHCLCAQVRHYVRGRKWGKTKQLKDWAFFRKIWGKALRFSSKNLTPVFTGKNLAIFSLLLQNFEVKSSLVFPSQS